MKKNLFRWLIALAILLPCLVISASAATSGYYTYSVSNGEATITDVNTSISGDITIPSTLGGYPVTSIGGFAFELCRSLTSVTIPDSVTSIRGGAFNNCWDLTSVTIPDSVTSIGDSAFSSCGDLTSVTIGNSVTSIGFRAFYDCDSLTSVTYTGDIAGWCGIFFYDPLANPMHYADNLYIDSELVSGELVIPDGVTRIGNSAFYGCSSLTSVTIPDSVTSIGSRAFYDCYNLTKVTIGNGVTSIGSRAFYDCYNLTSVTIGNSVTSIGDSAFSSCDGLTSVTIPDSVTSIGEEAFGNCATLLQIEVAEGNTAYCDIDGVLCNKDKTELVLFPGGKSGAYTIPNSVTSIGNYAFRNCDSLTSVTIPNSVTSIGYCAFFYCSGLTSVIIPDSVTSIGNSAFGSCTSLISVTIPDSVTSIGDGVFANCEGLTSVTIPDSVTSIGEQAFFDCDSLTSVTIPDGVTSIGEQAFFDCDSLTEIKVAEGNTAYCDIDGVLCNKDKTELVLFPWGKSGAYTIPNSVTSIGDYAFRNCDSLTSVTIPDSVTSIGDHAFYRCDNLTSVTIGNGVTSIGRYAFEECNSLTSVTIGNSVTSIGDYAFYYCDSLTRVYYTGDIAGWCGISFGGIHAYPKRGADIVCKLYIGGELVSGELVIPDGVTSIGSYAFFSCDGLTSVTIPDSVTSIGSCAFYNCDSLTDVYYIGDEAGWQAISIEWYNEPLTNATIHYVLDQSVGEVSHGTVTLSAEFGEVGDTIVVTAIPEKGYMLKAIYVDGVAIEGNSYTISGNHVVTAVFEKKAQEQNELRGYFSLAVVNTIVVDGQEVQICRWVWTPFEG